MTDGTVNDDDNDDDDDGISLTLLGFSLALLTVDESSFDV